MPRLPKLSLNDELLLSAALEGLEVQRQRIEEQIQEVRGRLGSTAGSTRAGRPAALRPRKKRVLSAAARKRISQAQRKRWAEYRKKTRGNQKKG